MSVDTHYPCKSRSRDRAALIATKLPSIAKIDHAAEGNGTVDGPVGMALVRLKSASPIFTLTSGALEGNSSIRNFVDNVPVSCSSAEFIESAAMVPV